MTKSFQWASLFLFLVIAGDSVAVAATQPQSESSSSIAWPPITRQQRPWAYWWWMGSAVDKTNLTRELQRYHDAGYGGVHIIPIYGAKGWEDKYISYLSPQWMEMLAHTVSEAHRLDLGVDMTTGTGWCFGGGTNVTEREGNASVVVKTFDAPAGAKLPEKFDRTNTQALVAFSPEGASVELTDRIAIDGTVNWAAPGNGWRVYAVSQKFSGQKVKRSSPGGEGPMLNLFYTDAMRSFLRTFTGAFDNYKGPKPRAQYHDSYEYKSEWSPDFFAQFKKWRGYRLQTELPALFASDRNRRREEADFGNTNRLLTSAATERTARVLCDYRETVSDIMAEESLPLWVKWSHDHGFLTRNEAHGSPGNLLDLYAVADIPETEMFHTDRNKLISKFASSAAHVTGKNLVGSETGTWLEEHFTETLADMKFLLDDLFLSGVNHVFYHGTCYSPDEAGWPGWVFYASYEMNPRNSVWHDVPALNAYVARCQSVLQGGRPDNDILLYWPIHDFWSQPGRTLLPHMTVHARDWFESQPIGRTAKELWERGYAFDYVSDAQLKTAKVVDGKIQMPGGKYQVIVVPECKFIPLETFKQLLALAENGATVIFESPSSKQGALTLYEKKLPADVSGFKDYKTQQAEFQKLTSKINFESYEALFGRIWQAKCGKGKIVSGRLIVNEWPLDKITQEIMPGENVETIRRSFEGGWNYFIANRGQESFNHWILLARTAKSVVLLDPLTGNSGLAKSQIVQTNWTKVWIQLAAGESVILRAFADKKVGGPAWNYWQANGEPVEITGLWNVKFIEGGPALPADFQTAKLASWTTFPDTNAQAFAGTARYSLKFDAPASSSRSWSLSLGNVCQSARLRLNGKELGTLITPPFRVVVDKLKPSDNELEVEVTNVSANRIRDLDRRGVKWKNFNDINFVNINYRPFDASDWPLYDSGLLGPVTLTAVAPAMEVAR
jgi:alpha-L-rhamnosidase